MKFHALVFASISALTCTAVAAPVADRTALRGANLDNELPGWLGGDNLNTEQMDRSLLSGGKLQTMPEFKEIGPGWCVDAQGRTYDGIKIHYTKNDMLYQEAVKKCPKQGLVGVEDRESNSRNRDDEFDRYAMCLYVNNGAPDNTLALESGRFVNRRGEGPVKDAESRIDPDTGIERESVCYCLQEDGNCIVACNADNDCESGWCYYGPPLYSRPDPSEIPDQPFCKALLESGSDCWESKECASGMCKGQAGDFPGLCV